MESAKLKVSGKSNPKSVAGSIANNIREKKDVDITVMGPNAVNQAVKAIAIAREYMAADNVDICCRPEFVHLELDGEQKSAIRLFIIVKQK